MGRAVVISTASVGESREGMRRKARLWPSSAIAWSVSLWKVRVVSSFGAPQHSSSGTNLAATSRRRPLMAFPSGERLGLFRCGGCLRQGSARQQRNDKQTVRNKAEAHRLDLHVIRTGPKNPSPLVRAPAAPGPSPGTQAGHHRTRPAKTGFRQQKSARRPGREDRVVGRGISLVLGRSPV